MSKSKANKNQPHKVVNAQIAKERRHPTHATPNWPSKIIKGSSRRR